MSGIKCIHNCSSERKRHCVFALSADIQICETVHHLPALPDPDLRRNSGRLLQI
ncbi:hypothetical protein M9458_022148, partial [Cirrhinus mrigala]